MKIICAVCVYNRYENVKKWINAWKQSDTTDAQLCIIHNYNGDERIRQAVVDAYADDKSIFYIKRENVGYDIGCVQDICRERIKFEPSFDYLLWCADDTIPVRKDFIQQYLKTIQIPGCGLASMKNSPHQTLHVRTSGWMISKELSLKLKFPADPITTKEQCYKFEHRGKDLTLLNQIRNMGLDVRQVADDWHAPLWDSGYWRRKDRANEYYETFGGEAKKNDKIVFIATIYNTYPQIISSLLCQTYQNWELVLIHDGEAERWLRDIIFDKAMPVDKRIKWTEIQPRKQQYGHPLRQWALTNLDNLSDADYIVITNSDNYYVPVFCEYMLKAFKKSHTAVASYCDAMVHSYKAWQVIPVKFEKGYVDCGGIMVRREIAQEVGWRDMEHSADWTYFSDIASRYSFKNFIPVKGCLLIHN